MPEVPVVSSDTAYVDVPAENPPLGLPEGSVRAILAIFLVIGSWVAGFVLLINGTIDFDKFMAIVGVGSGTPLGYYFGARK